MLFRGVTEFGHTALNNSDAYFIDLFFLADSGGTAASQCAGCNKDVDSCQCQMIVYMFHETNRKLIELELLERLVGNVLTSLIYVRIKDHVHRVCDRSLDVSQLSSLEDVS